MIKLISLLLLPFLLKDKESCPLCDQMSKVKVIKSKNMTYAFSEPEFVGKIPERVGEPPLFRKLPEHSLNCKRAVVWEMPEEMLD